MIDYINKIQTGKTIIVITGPTASGKSDYVIRLANQINKNFNLESAVINADITQCYKGIEKLSASPTIEDKNLIPHQLYNFLDIQTNFSVGQWLEEVKKEINHCLQNHIVPIIVGGTVLYIDCLVNGISPIPRISKEVKQKSIDLFNKVGRDEFVSIVQKLIKDKEEIKGIPLDSQRLIRNHSLLTQTGKTLQYYAKLPKAKSYPDEDFIKIAILPDREIAYKKINERFTKNIDIYIEEVKKIMHQIDENHNLYKAHGFREIKDYILGNITKEHMTEMATMQIRRYNKRQRTWIRNQFKDFQIIEPSND